MDKVHPILYLQYSCPYSLHSPHPHRPLKKKKQEEEEEFREFREKKDFCPTFAVFLKSQRHLYIKRCLVPGAHCRLWMPETKNRDQTLAALACVAGVIEEGEGERGS